MWGLALSDVSYKCTSFLYSAEGSAQERLLEPSENFDIKMKNQELWKYSAPLFILKLWKIQRLI